MRDSAWREEEVAGVALDVRVRQVERHLALEHVEPLVLGLVDVQRRHLAGGHLDHVDDAQATVALLAVEEYARAGAQEGDFVRAGR